MKTILMILAVGTFNFGASAFADQPLRSCVVHVPDVSHLKFEIYSSKVITTSRGVGSGYDWTLERAIEVVTEAIHPGLEPYAIELKHTMLNGGTWPPKQPLGEGEKLLIMAEARRLLGISGAGPGFAINDARSVTLYWIGAEAPQGRPALVAARDRLGREIGFFYAGASSYPCDRN